MSDKLISPQQKDIYEQFKETFNEELAVLEKRRRLIKSWRALRIQEGIRKTNRALKKK